MNCAIVYFSQTGNTKTVAEAICKGITESGNRCDLYALEKVESAPERLKEYDVIGIGTPVFYFQPPYNVVDFIKSLSFLHGKHSFLFITHGGEPGRTFPKMAKLLRKNGIALIGTYRSRGAETAQHYVLAGYDLSPGHPNGREIAGAAEFGASIPTLYKKVLAGEIKEMPELKPHLDRWYLRGVYMTKPLVNLTTPRRRVDKELCDKCGACAKKCPSHVIRMNPYPEFRGTCLRCYYCEKICPKGAIKCNWKFVVWIGRRDVERHYKKNPEMECRENKYFRK